LEQLSGAVQLAHEVSPHPQVEHDPEAIWDIQAAWLGSSCLIY